MQKTTETRTSVLSRGSENNIQPRATLETKSAIMENGMHEEVSKPSINIQDEGVPENDEEIQPPEEVQKKNKQGLGDKLTIHCQKHSEMNRYCTYLTLISN